MIEVKVIGNNIQRDFWGNSAGYIHGPFKVMCSMMNENGTVSFTKQYVGKDESDTVYVDLAQRYLVIRQNKILGDDTKHSKTAIHGDIITVTETKGELF